MRPLPCPQPLHSTALLGLFTVLSLPVSALAAPDIFVGAKETANISCIQQLDGSFSCANASTSDTVEGYRAELNDIDGDGWNDTIIWGRYATAQVCLNNADGTGTFTCGVAVNIGTAPGNGGEIEVADLDGDGTDEYVMSTNGGGSQICAYDPTIVGLTGCTTRSEGGDVVARDFDNDGDIDLVYTEYTQVEVCLNDGTGAFSCSATSYDGISARYQRSFGDLADVDGDGDQDVIVATYYQFSTTPGQGIAVCLNDGSGGLSGCTPAGIPLLAASNSTVGTFDLVAGDLNGDGYGDFALGGYNHGTPTDNPSLACLSNGDGTWACQDLLWTGMQATSSVAIGDLDGDGDQDIVASSYRGSSYTGLCLNDGSGSMACSGVTSGANSQVMQLAIGEIDEPIAGAVVITDTDGDGIPDSEDLCPGYDDLADADADGTADGCDACPMDAYGDSDGDGACDSDDACPFDIYDDSDGDGVCDSDDLCPADELDDMDYDGICDSDDVCPDDAQNDADGDGVCGNLDACEGGDDSLDADTDGTADFCDVCPADFFNDSDGDGFCDSDDLCPMDYADDSDGDGSCDSDDLCPADFDNDIDGDAICGDVDPCPVDWQNDADGDGFCESDDNCPSVFNVTQSNVDGDAYGDACEPDNDNDGVVDDDDNCPLDSNADQDDFDGDGMGDVCDTDTDDDGVIDGGDACLDTVVGEPVLTDGCSWDQECVCEASWKNHGAYVSCVAHATNDLVSLGLITSTEKGVIQSEAGASSCGAKSKGKGK